MEKGAILLEPIAIGLLYSTSAQNPNFVHIKLKIYAHVHSLSTCVGSMARSWIGSCEIADLVLKFS